MQNTVAKIQSTQNGEYHRLCHKIDITPINKSFSLSKYLDLLIMAESSVEERITAALYVLLQWVAGDGNTIQRVDRVLLDHYIAKIDEVLNNQLDAILHNADFQSLEAAWRSLLYLVERTDFQANTSIEILDINKECLRTDFDNAVDITQSGLYKHVYTQEYDTPGGEPISAIISDYEFDSSILDIELLRQIAKVAATTHCPFIAAAEAKFFHKKDINEVLCIDDLPSYMERAEYIRWKSLRENEDCRFIGLTLPRFILRLPYGIDNPINTFNYQEHVAGATAKNYLWGNASFALAVNIGRSFKKYGWAVNIRGPESGGKVENLPLHNYDIGRGFQTKIPTEVLIPETSELAFAEQGFIPLCYYKNTDFACFFSANSIHKPALYNDEMANANARINSRLPYVFLSARLGHYLKVFQRENIGSNKSHTELEQELDRWLQTVGTKMNNPGPELAATHPLREGKITVEMAPNNPGFYRVNLIALPHFQIEGVDVRLAVVAQLPGKDT
ncbi:type VI secretion system contractile sheath large subunit [soil metagenome]